jgi:3',5'-cyclic AMP phosphodiesterase CpdA
MRLEAAMQDARFWTRVMKGTVGVLSLALVLPGTLTCPAVAEDENSELVFIVAADMRNFSAQGEWSKNFSGACEAARDVGPGAFMISPGDLDVDPPSAVRDMISRVIGDDYPWYPVLGNHDPESPSTMRYLRTYGQTVPNGVTRGPEGCEETTYSFEWANAHFVVLNQYFDGVKDWGLEGDVVPELLDWLEADLAANTKDHVFVIGHEPLMPMPDMDNGRVRHQGDSLDEHPENAFRFHQLLLKHGVTAYICGHTHNTSYANLNGLWQLDAGHARGLEEASYADALYAAIRAAMDAGRDRGVGEAESLRQLYRDDAYHIDRWFKYLGMTETPVVQTLAQFYDEYSSDPTARDRYYERQIEGRQQTASTFLRFIVTGESIKVEFYRDDAHGGPYSLRESLILD